MKFKFLKSIDPKLVALLFLQLILIFLAFDFEIFMGGDAHSDILLAKSILSSSGFRDIWDPQQPQDNWRQPAMPVLIAALYAIFGDNYMAIKFLVAFLTCGITILIYLLFKKELGHQLWFLLMLFVTNAVLLEFSHYELTEIPYLFVVLLSFYFWQKKKYVATLICIILSYHFRNEALALLGGYLIYFVIQRNWRNFLVFGFSFWLGILPWTIRSLLIGGNVKLKVLLAKDELDLDAGMIGFSDLIQRVFHNFKYYFLEEGGVVVLNDAGFLSVLIMLVAFIGLLKFNQFSQTGKLILWFVLLHFVVMLFWQPQATHYRNVRTSSSAIKPIRKDCTPRIIIMMPIWKSDDCTTLERKSSLRINKNDNIAVLTAIKNAP